MKTSAITGFLAKFDTGFTSLHYSTYLNRFSPAAIFPHPEGGYLVVGSGRADMTDGPNGVVFLRVTEQPQGLPRIDSAIPAEASGRPGDYPILSGGTLLLTGDGFAQNSIMLFNGRVVPFQFTSKNALSVTVPKDAPRGPATIQLETGPAQSQQIRLEIRY